MVRMITLISKSKLLQAVTSTYADSLFFVGYGVEDDCDFTQRLCRNRSAKCVKAELLDMIRQNAPNEIISVPGHPDYLVLSKNLFVSRGSINDNQVFNTNIPEGYYHSVCKYNRHLEVYIKIDKEQKTISFLLGDQEKTLELVEYSGYVYKFAHGRMYCQSADDMERFMKDDFWNPAMIVVGRHILKIALAA